MRSRVDASHPFAFTIPAELIRLCAPTLAQQPRTRSSWNNGSLGNMWGYNKCICLITSNGEHECGRFYHGRTGHRTRIRGQPFTATKCPTSHEARLLARTHGHLSLSPLLLSFPPKLTSLLRPWSSFKFASSQCLPLASVPHRVSWFSLVCSLLLPGCVFTLRNPVINAMDRLPLGAGMFMHDLL
jgi:hypothetical protein